MTDTKDEPRIQRSRALGGSDIGRCLTAIHHDRFTPSVRIRDAVSMRLAERGRTHEDIVVDHLVALTPEAAVVPYRTPRTDAIAITREAMDDGAPLIVGGRLVDEGEEDIGFPDLLVRMDDGYTAVEIKNHKVVGDSGPTGFIVPLEALPSVDVTETRFRSNRKRDLLQVAHYRALLAATGHASSAPLGGVIGSDLPLSCVWVDLAQGEQSILEEYDRYVAAARAVITHGDTDPTHPMVAPYWRGECDRCDWAAMCRAELAAVSDPTLLRGVGVDLRDELAQHGVTTIDDIADLPIDDPVIDDTDVVTQARAMTTGVLLRSGDGTHAEGLPSAPLEVDLDIETIDGRIYLAGLLLTTHGVSSFEPIVEWSDGDDAERAVLERLFARFSEWTDDDTVVFHWTGYETRTIAAAADRHGLSIEGFTSVEDWFAAHAFDLYRWTRRHFVSPAGYSLKVIAPLCGFTWRDEDPGGLQSEIWYEQLQAGDTSMRNRLLAYNEDDVIAQREVRRWARAADSGKGPASAVPSVLDWPGPASADAGAPGSEGSSS